MLLCWSSFMSVNSKTSFLLSWSSHLTTQDHGECHVQHPQYPILSNATIPSLDDCTVLTIITWNTQYPSGKLQRERGISLFPHCHRSAHKHCQHYFKRGQTRSICNLHVIFLSALCPLEKSCAFSSQWNNNKGKKTSTRFFICDQKRQGCFPSCYAQNYCWGWFSALISTTKTTGRMQPCSTKVNLGGT